MKGRPDQEAAPGPRWIAGADIGGTNLVVGIVRSDGGGPVGVRTAPTRPQEGAAATVRRIATMAREAAAAAGVRFPEDVAGIGAGVPGLLDPASGSVLETPNMGWKNVPMPELLAEAAGVPAILHNDADCAAYGEWRRGAGQGARCLVCLTLGTGIGGGIVLDGQLYQGASSGAGEVGHTCVEINGRLCGCGARGCVEAYASGPAIAARAVEAGYGDGRPGDVTAEAVCGAAADGDRVAARVVAEAGTVLGVAVANLVHVLAPDVIVLAGGVARAGELLFAPLRREVRRRAFAPARAACRIVPAAFPETAGVVGAAELFNRARAQVPSRAARVPL